MKHVAISVLVCLLASTLVPAAHAETWTPDNGDGTFTNPLFYEEFSDPDLIRVGEDYYLTGTTMHSMPGLPILHSRDLVNWKLLGYALDRLDLGPEFRLEDGKHVYGQGIWAPSFRYHNGTFYIFSNVNRHTTQVFTATNPAGPWKRHAMKRSLHDVSVLFDDDGKIWAIWGYRGIRLAQLNDALDDIVPGSEREIIPEHAGMGEGVHFYKVDGKYFILSAWYQGRMRMPAARADKVDGPYEVNLAVSIDEDFGLPEGNRLTEVWARQKPFVIKPGEPKALGRMSLHQGGIVQTPLGEWWGFSMMDYNSLGRVTALSPITWKDGWPYFGLPDNLTRTPRTWVKPRTTERVEVSVPFQRNDTFDGPTLANVWQWNHVPVDDAWKLEDGALRLTTLPATSLWDARNTLTQRAMGPKSSPITVLDTSQMRDGDVAGLALFNRPYAWIGVERVDGKTRLAVFNDLDDTYVRQELPATRVYLRADCDYIAETASFSYSLDGKTYTPLGEPVTLVFQLGTFQGIRYSLFAFNTRGATGGTAAFESFEVLQPHPRGLMRPIPYAREATFVSLNGDYGLGAKGNKLAAAAPVPFRIHPMGFGRAALEHRGRYLTIGKRGVAKLAKKNPGEAESFQWIETPNGDLVLMSLVTHRFLRIDPESKQILADSPGPLPDGSDGVRFRWQLGE